VIYKFKSKGAGDVIMLGPSGDQILRLLGREPAAKGIIEVKDMPAAIAALERAVAADEAKPADDEDDEDTPRGSSGGGVSLRQRAWPLVEMMRRCHGAGHDIVWGV
jgi:hypothetical protein